VGRDSGAFSNSINDSFSFLLFPVFLFILRVSRDDFDLFIRKQKVLLHVGIFCEL
jgi:hypothetical protein